MNRATHGFCASVFITPEEDGHEFIALLNDLVTEHQPMTTTERILVEQMAQNQWLTQRALNLQGEAFLNLSLGGKAGAIPANLGLLIRYHTAAGRAFHRAHNELVKAQKERKKSEIGFEPQKASEPVDIPRQAGPITAETILSDEKIAPQTPRVFNKAA